MNSYFFFVVTIIGLYGVTFAQSTSPSPLYITGGLSYAPTTALFYELDIVSGETRNVTTFPVNLHEESQLWGGVIYYETGIFYGLYQNITTKQSYLMSINTITGEKLNMQQELPGVVYSLAIDQSIGQIHFLNYTFASKGIIYGDWTIYDIKSNEFQILQSGVANNDELTKPCASVYNTETQTLSFLTYTIKDYLLIEFSLNLPPPSYSSTNIVAAYNVSGTFYLQMAINPKSNDVYIIGYTSIVAETQVITVNMIESVNNGMVEMSTVCTYEKDVKLSGNYITVFQADVDYASNSIVFGENASVRTDVEDYLWVVQLNTCDIWQYKVSHTYEIGVPRFFPPSN